MMGPNISARGLKNIRLCTLEIHSLTRFFAPREAIFKNDVHSLAIKAHLYT